MPAIKTYASPVDDYVKVKIPDAYRAYSFRVVLVPVVEHRQRYDFSDLVGKLQWQGDAVAVQRSMRDEW